MKIVSLYLPDLLKHRLEQLAIGDATVKQYDSYQELEQDKQEAWDVLLIDSNHLKKLKDKILPESQIIVFNYNQKKLNQLYHDAKDFDVYSIISQEDLKDLESIIKGAYQNLIKQMKKSERNNQSVIVTSFKSGVGKSLITYHLAYLMKKFLKENQTLVLDFSQPFGSAQSLVNIESSFSWATIKPLLSEKEQLTYQRLKGVIKPTQFHFDLLPHPGNLKQNLSLDPQAKRKLHHKAREIYRLTLEDSYTIQSEQDITNLDVADLICVVLNQDNAAIYNTYLGLKTLKEHPDLFKKTIFVLNQYQSDQDHIFKKMLSERLGIDFFATIEEDPQAVHYYQDRTTLISDSNLVIHQDFGKFSEKLFKHLF